MIYRYLNKHHSEIDDAKAATNQYENKNAFVSFILLSFSPRCLHTWHENTVTQQRVVTQSHLLGQRYSHNIRV